MGTLTGLLGISTSALLANQTALNATANNISNQNTAGYTRRAANFTEGDVVTVAGNQPGVSVSVTATRDNVLLKSVQQATETSSASSTRSSALNDLQSIFKLDASGNDASGIGAAISGFFSAASTLAATPNDTTAQQSLYTAAQTVASTLNRAAGQISAQTASLNNQVTDSVKQVNTLTSQIALLNRQITNSAASDSRDALIDQRDTLVTNLSQLVDVNSISNSDGSLDLALSNGIPLVSSSTAQPLSTATVSGTVQIYASVAAGGSNVTSAVRGGSIGGALEARDSDLPAVSSQLDALASAITTAVNAQNAAGTTASGTAGGAIFSGNTAATITVVASSGAAFATIGAGGSSNALALSGIQDSALVGGQTLTNSFSTMLSGLGQTASAASTQSTADSAILTQTSTQYDQTTGVSLDQEGSNLTQYQRSYEAAAKVLTIVDQLLAEAINLGQETTVS